MWTYCTLFSALLATCPSEPHQHRANNPSTSSNDTPRVSGRQMKHTTRPRLVSVAYRQKTPEIEYTLNEVVVLRAILPSQLES